MNVKTKGRFKSIRFKLWAYFFLFSMIIILFLYALQGLFLNYYFSQMKQAETTKIANQIVDTYDRNHNSLQKLIKTMDVLAETNDDIYMRIETLSGETVVAPYSDSLIFPRYGTQIQKLREMLADGSKRYVSGTSTTQDSKSSDDMVFSYACFLEKNLVAPDVADSIGAQSLKCWGPSSYVLYILTPLHPARTTVSIINSQYFYAALIALILSFVIALYFSKRISRPLKSITRAAAEMGKGNYGVQFAKSDYTEINELADTLTHASHELERTEMYQRDLIANVSHDLRTPLTMIKSYAEMIRDLSGNIPEKRDAHLGVIIDETDRLNTLVTDLLNLRHMQNKTIILEKTYFDIKQAAESILASYEIRCQQEGYNLVFNCNESLTVYGDESKIKQVIANLVGNAFKFCGEDKTIIVNIKRNGKKVRCEVRDNGSGIAPDEIDHVWERYYKSSSNMVRPVEGSGLGLSIVKEILILHKSQYGVTSKLGKGTTFWFEMNVVKNKNSATHP